MRDKLEQLFEEELRRACIGGAGSGGGALCSGEACVVSRAAVAGVSRHLRTLSAMGPRSGGESPLGSFDAIHGSSTEKQANNILRV